MTFIQYIPIFIDFVGTGETQIKMFDELFVIFIGFNAHLGKTTKSISTKKFMLTLIYENWYKCTNDNRWILLMYQMTIFSVTLDLLTIHTYNSLD